MVSFPLDSVLLGEGLRNAKWLTNSHSLQIKYYRRLWNTREFGSYENYGPASSVKLFEFDSSFKSKEPSL